MERNTDLLSAEIVDAAIHIHKKLGPGLLESVHEQVLARELTRRGLKVERQKPVTFEFDGMRFENMLTVDLLVNETIVVEVKAAERNRPVFRRQTFTYLRLLELEVALLLNFGTALMKDGITRIVNGYRPTPESRLRLNRPGAESEP